MKQNITVKIWDREFSLAVDAEMEENIRLAARRVNDKISSNINHYENVSVEEIMCMLLLEEETKLVEMELDDKGQTHDILHKLQQLDVKLGEYLLSR
jgi:Cell division protein ZapA.